MLGKIFQDSQNKVQASIQKVADAWARDTQDVLANDFGCNVQCVEGAIQR